ncbi:molybdopterin-dependent oxidoreductase [Paracoccaceae bacterium Fryx2]|nr:molybdopterin-dependent oxidoreductase [Paracoccaceae bacterium Fryx2]
MTAIRTDVFRAELSRRAFLNYTAALGAIGMVGTGLPTTGARAQGRPDGQVLTGSHWGAFRATVMGGRFVSVTPWEKDTAPGAHLEGLLDSVFSPARIRYPMVRRAWAAGGPGTAPETRGTGDFVRVTWDEALDLVAAELRRVEQTHGPAATFAGSCGWKTVGRLHNCQSLLRRMMNLKGGFAGPAGDHSTGAAQAMPHVTGTPEVEQPTAWPVAVAVAPVIDMLLNPGAEFDHNGTRATFPDIRLAYWAGGNPFGHHQDRTRMVEAWKRPDTLIVQDSQWTAAARHADIVLPAATSYERNDIESVGDASGRAILAMKQVIAPLFESRSDYDIFAAIAGRLGRGAEFTQGLSEMDWIARFYGDALRQATARGMAMPDFDTFWNGDGVVEFPLTTGESFVRYAGFRKDPLPETPETPAGLTAICARSVGTAGRNGSGPLPKRPGTGRHGPAAPGSRGRCGAADGPTAGIGTLQPARGNRSPAVPPMV